MNKIKKYFLDLHHFLTRSAEPSQPHSMFRHSQTDQILNVSKLETELLNAKMQIVALSVSGELITENLRKANQRIVALLLINEALMQEIQNPTPNER